MVSRSCRCCASFSANTGSPATAAATAFACGPESWPSAKAINVSSSIFIGGLRLSTAQRPDERGATAQQAAGERADRDCENIRRLGIAQTFHQHEGDGFALFGRKALQIGRAACRARVCEYV